MLKASFAVLLGACAAQRCIKPGWRNASLVRSTPGPEQISYNSKAQPWADNSCCTSEYTRRFDEGGIGAIYTNFSYDYCPERISDRCRQFLDWEEAFYACDPYAAYFEDPNYEGSFSKLPLCQNFCDDWYEACSEDSTCATDWVNDFYGNDVNGVYTWQGCVNPTCSKFKTRFSSGTDMCQRMWSTNFVVSADPKKCFSPWFYSVNPNSNPAGIKTSGAAGTALSVAAGLAVAAAVYSSTAARGS